MTKNKNKVQRENYWGLIILGVIFIFYLLLNTIPFYIEWLMDYRFLFNISEMFFNGIIYTFPILLFLSILLMIYIYFKYIHPKDREAILKVTYVGICLTFILILGSLPQLYNIKSQSKADFILRLQSKFYDDPKNNIIIQNIDNYYDDSEKYIRLLDTTDKYEKNACLKQAKAGTFEVTEWGLDRYLSIFDYMSLIWKKGVLTEDEINSLFGWYISRAWKNKEVRRYIEEYREKKDPELYDQFKKLAEIIVKKQDDAKLTGVCDKTNKKLKIYWSDKDNIIEKVKNDKGNEYSVEWRIYRIKDNVGKVLFSTNEVWYECKTIQEIADSLTGNKVNGP